MNREHHGPIINSRHHSNMPKPNKGIYVIIFLIVIALIATGVLAFIQSASPITDDIEYYDEDYNNEPIVTEEITTEAIEGENEILETETKTASYYYKSGLKQEEVNDYAAALEDYGKAIELAKNNSSEMFNSLNNRGYLNAKHFKDYDAALADFNQIIKIENDKLNPNNKRLVAGYSNRAYVKKMKGDKDGACNDLYEALYIADENAISKIDKQIGKVCY